MRLDVFFDFSGIYGLEDVIFIRGAQALTLRRCKLLAVGRKHLDMDHVASLRLLQRVIIVALQDWHLLLSGLLCTITDSPIASLPLEDVQRVIIISVVVLVDGVVEVLL
jgi:hypothetical protein